jgi:MFS family permease
MAFFAARAGSAVLMYVALTVAGLSFGGIFPMIVIITSELFGKKNAGGNIMFLNGWTGCVPALAFGKFLAQAVYHAHIEDDAGGGATNTCYGPGCFGETHLIIAAACVLGAAFSAMLGWKSLPLYRRIWEQQVPR